MSDRLSAERLRRIRDYYGDFPDLAVVLAELDAVTRERDDLQARLDDFISARATGRSANDDA